MHVHQSLTVFITNSNLLGVNMLSAVSHYSFPWELHIGIFYQGKNLISYTKKILTVATCRDIVKPKRYYPVFLTCIELAIGVLQ